MYTALTLLTCFLLSVNIRIVQSFLTVNSQNKFDEAKLRGYVESTMKCEDIQGIQVAVVYRNKTVFTGGFGYKDVQSKSPMTPDYLMGLASISKSFASAVAARAVDEGKITWDGALYNSIPNDFNFELQSAYRTAHVSLRDLFGHRTGMPSYWGVASSGPNYTLQDLARHVKYFPVKYDLRDKLVYSNYGTTLGAAAVEITTNKTYEDQLNDFFQKIGMNSSRASSRMNDSDWKKVAPSYTKWKDGVWRPHDERAMEPAYTSILPAGGIFSNANDMAKWLRFHLNEGKNEKGEQVVSKGNLQETYKALHAWETMMLLKPKYRHAVTETGYAMGWKTGTYRGYKMLTHTGGISAYSLAQHILPDAGVAVWVGSNSLHTGSVFNICFFVLDMLLQDKQWIPNIRVCPNKQTKPIFSDIDETYVDNFVFETSNSGNTTQVNLDEYVGIYEHPAFGVWSIKRNCQQLTYTFGQLLNGQLNPTAKDDIFEQTIGPPYEFRSQNLKYTDYVVFARNAKGNVTTITIPYLEYSLPPTFYRK